MDVEARDVWSRTVKILLIYPSFLDIRIKAEDVGVVPIGLYYIGAILKEHRHDVEILNWHDMKDRDEEMSEMLREKRPDIIGFSIVNANRWGAIDAAKTAKRVLPNVVIVFGGIGATFLWRHLMEHFGEIDYIVLGEGEDTFLKLVSCLESKRIQDISTIKGIVYRSGKRIHSTGPAEPIRDLDRLPMPSEYFTFQHVSSSRGCPSACTFCGSPRFWGRRVRFHSPEYFVRQLEQLYQKGVSFFYVSDDTFTMREDRVIQICEKIIEKRLPITWFAISKVNAITERMLYFMRRAGCIQISFGVESGAETIRRVLNKDISTDAIKTAFALTRKYGILPRAYFIYGSPGETPETIQQTVDLMNEIKPLSAIFYILDIFPGTALYDDFVRKSGVGDDIWLERIEDIMYCETDTRLTPDTILSYGKTLRSAFYRSLPRFANEIELVEREDLASLHADFLSRLGLTFSHGDYATIDDIPDKEQTAEQLFRRALSYAPHPRAYLGLGILLQRRGDYAESIKILSEGLNHFPENEQIAICCGVSHLYLARYDEALRYFDAFPHSPEALRYRAYCHRMMRLPNRRSVS